MESRLDQNRKRTISSCRMDAFLILNKLQTDSQIWDQDKYSLAWVQINNFKFLIDSKFQTKWGEWIMFLWEISTEIQFVLHRAIGRDWLNNKSSLKTMDNTFSSKEMTQLTLRTNIIYTTQLLVVQSLKLPFQMVWLEPQVLITNSLMQWISLHIKQISKHWTLHFHLITKQCSNKWWIFIKWIYSNHNNCNSPLPSCNMEVCILSSKPI